MLPESLSPQVDLVVVWRYFRVCSTGGIVVGDSGSGRNNFRCSVLHWEYALYAFVDNLFLTRAVCHATCEVVGGGSETLEAPTKSLKILSRGTSACGETAYVFRSGPTGKGMDGTEWSHCVYDFGVA